MMQPMIAGTAYGIKIAIRKNFGKRSFPLSIASAAKTAMISMIGTCKKKYKKTLPTDETH